jgi:UPF0716 protein FxsA
MMSGSFAFGSVGPFGRHMKRWLGLWLMAEVVAFVAVVKLIGMGPTLVLMIATSVLGLSVLRRVGLGATSQLRGYMAGGGAPNDAFVDGTLTALGSLLLILPGFVSDIAGLALATPSIRHHVASRLIKTTGSRAPVSRRGPADVIDLGPEDWRVIDRPTRG